MKTHLKSLGRGFFHGLNDLFDLTIDNRYPLKNGKSMPETDPRDAIDDDMRRVYGDIYQGMEQFKKEADITD